jgi:hypothetical protein
MGVSIADTDEEDAVGAKLAATAVSRRRTVLAAVNIHGYAVGLRLLDDSAREWDADTLGRRATEVAEVAHQRYLAGLHIPGTDYPSMQAVADAEAELDF